MLIKDVFFLPPMAIARVGGSDIPLESFEWAEDPSIHGASKTVIEPAITLEVGQDGSVRPYLPSVIRFRDGDKLRPTAPFYELWAIVQVDVDDYREMPITLDLLEKAGGKLSDIHYRVTVANLKASRRTGEAACSFIARADVRGNDHKKQKLLAISPHTSGQQPLVLADKPIPLGDFQVIRPIKVTEMGVDLSVLRVRFTPAKGEVYGTPKTITGPASPLPPGDALPAVTERGRIHEIVPEKNRILNPNTSWSTYIMEVSPLDPQPCDSYDGANVGNSQSWGVVDDSCDGVIEASLIINGKRFMAQARVFSGPPDYAPDRRPFYAVTDDLADRDQQLEGLKEKTLEETEADIADLFRRVWETSSLANLPATRRRALLENRINAPAPNPDLPPTTGPNSMTQVDAPYFQDLIGDELTAEVPKPEKKQVEVNYLDLAKRAHEELIDIDNLLYFLHGDGGGRSKQHIIKLIRPAFGSFAELADNTDRLEDENYKNDKFRDPRAHRDSLQDMRMPPYMRDSDEMPLSLNRRQYTQLIEFIKSPFDLEQETASDSAPVEGSTEKKYPLPIQRRAKKLKKKAEKSEQEEK
jgi:hypothetical protein